MFQLVKNLDQEQALRIFHSCNQVRPPLGKVGIFKQWTSWDGRNTEYWIFLGINCYAEREIIMSSKRDKPSDISGFCHLSWHLLSFCFISLWRNIFIDWFQMIRNSFFSLLFDLFLLESWGVSEADGKMVLKAFLMMIIIMWGLDAIPPTKTNWVAISESFYLFYYLNWVEFWVLNETLF